MGLFGPYTLMSPSAPQVGPNASLEGERAVPLLVRTYTSGERCEVARALKFGRRQASGVEPLGGTDDRLDQVAWFAGVSAIAFLIPLVFSSLLDLHHDLYY